MFNVFTISSYAQRDSGLVGRYIVSDQPENYKTLPPWPNAAEFPVSMRYDQKTQLRRAIEYCEYMNKGLTVQPPIGV